MKKKSIKKNQNNYKQPKTHKPQAETYPHFRYYNKSKHPALITDEHSADEYQYRKVTHSERETRHINEKVYPNPNPLDPKPMFIVKRKRHDKKKNFSEWKYPWRYPPKK